LKHRQCSYQLFSQVFQLIDFWCMDFCLEEHLTWSIKYQFYLVLEPKTSNLYGFRHWHWSRYLGVFSWSWFRMCLASLYYLHFLLFLFSYFKKFSCYKICEVSESCCLGHAESLYWFYWSSRKAQVFAL